MREYQFSSTNRIRVGNREFKSVEGLIKSGYTKGVVKKLVADYICWWKQHTVKFPDKGYYGSAFVEVTRNRVSIGYPSNYYSYNFPKIREALEFAEYVNNAWLAFEGDGDQFLLEQMPTLENEFKYSLDRQLA